MRRTSHGQHARAGGARARATARAGAPASLATLALVLVLAPGAPLQAQPAVYSPWGGPDSPGGLFGGDPLDADVNRDQRVTRDEFWTWMRDRVTGADLDRNGLTAQELGIRPNDRSRQAWFRAADADGNGRLTLGEVEAYTGTVFRFHDTNSDNALTPQEVRPARPRRGAAPAAPGGTAAPAPAPAPSR